MQNLLIIIFPLLIDGMNSIGGLQNPRFKFWIAIATSLIGGILLNSSALFAVLQNPSPDNVAGFLTLMALIITSTQGLYLKYWEGHDFRQTLFPTLSVNKAESPIAQ